MSKHYYSSLIGPLIQCFLNFFSEDPYFKSHKPHKQPKPIDIIGKSQKKKVDLTIIEQ